LEKNKKFGSKNARAADGNVFLCVCASFFAAPAALILTLYHTSWTPTAKGYKTKER